LLPFSLALKGVSMMDHYYDSSFIPGFVLMILSCAYGIFGAGDAELRNFFGWVSRTNQHKDAANFMSHQDLAHRGLMDSYDPMQELAEESTHRRNGTGANRRSMPGENRPYDPKLFTLGQPSELEVKQLQERQGDLSDLSGGEASLSGMIQKHRRRSIKKQASFGVGGPADFGGAADFSGASISSTSSVGSDGRAAFDQTSALSDGRAAFDQTLNAIAQLEDEIGSVESVLEEAFTAVKSKSAAKSATFGGAMATLKEEDETNATSTRTSGQDGQAARDYATYADPETGKKVEKHCDEMLKKSDWRPFIWKNPRQLPIVTMCPNSGEAAHVRHADLWTEHYSDHFGTARWDRSARMSGATEVQFFSTSAAMREWIDANLRVKIDTVNSALGKAPEPSPAPAASAMLVGTQGTAYVGPAETGRFIYTGMPVSIVAPTDVDPHHFESQHTDSKSQWILTLCRDRDEFPNLQWKMLVAESRRDLHLMFQMHGCTDEVEWPKQHAAGRTYEELMEDRRGDGDAKWEVQTIVAELCPSDETHGYVWTRWIAVLRAGAEPLNVAGVHTNVANRIDWGVGHTAMDADLEPRLAEGFHLLAVASTEHTLNEHVMACKRKGTTWAEQFVFCSPTWPSDWMNDEGPSDESMLISYVSFAGNSWTIVYTQSATAQALSNAGVRATPPVEQQVLVSETWPDGQFAELLCAGYTLTTVGRGAAKLDGRVATVYVLVLTLSPSTVVPRIMRSFGSAEALIQRWRNAEHAWHKNWTAQDGVRVSASLTGESGIDVKKMMAQTWAYRQQNLGSSVLNALDGDISSCWCSGPVPNDAVVTVTVDLGALRMVDEIDIFWGDYEPLPMARSWELVGSTGGGLEGPDAASLERLYEVSDQMLHEKHAPFERNVLQHVENYSANLIKIEPARRVRVVQLRLKVPQDAINNAGRVGYCVRHMKVLGPGPHAAAMPKPPPMMAAPSKPVRVFDGRAELDVAGPDLIIGRVRESKAAQGAADKELRRGTSASSSCLVSPVGSNVSDVSSPEVSLASSNTPIVDEASVGLAGVGEEASLLQRTASALNATAAATAAATTAPVMAAVNLLSGSNGSKSTSGLTTTTSEDVGPSEDKRESGGDSKKPAIRKGVPSVFL